MYEVNLNTDFVYENNKDNYKHDTESAKIQNKKLISLGKCSKFYLYILGSALFKLLSLILLGNSDKNIGLFSFSPFLSSYSSMQSIYTYSSCIIFGIIQYFYSRKNKTNIKNETTFFIHDKILKQKKGKTKLFLFFTCFFFSFYKEIHTIINILGFNDLNFWAFEKLFTFLLMRRYFKLDIHKHHICSITVIFIICLILQIIYVFLPNSNGKNFFEKKEGILTSYWYVLIFITIFLFLDFNYAFSHNYAKVLMQVKFVSHSTLIIIIGFTGLVLSLIISSLSIISNYSEINSFNFINYYKDLNSSNTWEIMREILIVLPSYLIFQFMQINLEILTIYYLTPIHCLLLNNFSFSIQKVFIFLTSNDKEIRHFLLSEITELIAICGYVIYLEILELNFCGLSDNIKRNIIAKGEEEFQKLSIHNTGNNNILDENEEEEDEIGDTGTGKMEEMIIKRKKSKNGE